MREKSEKLIDIIFTYFVLIKVVFLVAKMGALAWYILVYALQDTMEIIVRK